ncbi:MAG: efflux RND transporter permease subunit [Planctomycetaceae bacterium]|nr:efflux RND transporter permease subunit [Planctomycetaceae bacterium]
MNLPRFAIRFRPIVVTLVTLLMFWGVVSYLTMPRREDPEYTVRTCAVITRWPGAPAQKVEELITDKLEEAIDSIEEVDVVRSTSTPGLSEIYVDTEDYVSAEKIDNVWDKVRARVDRVEMPEAQIRPIVNDEFGDVSILLLGVTQVPLEGRDTIPPAQRYTPRQLELVAEDVQDALRLLPGVSKVELYGVRDEAIFIETDNRTWSQLGLTVSDLQKLLEARNIVAPGGTIDTDIGRFFVKPGGELNAVEEVNGVIVNTGQETGEKRPITLSDVGLNVRRAYQDPPSRICRIGNGDQMSPAIVVALQMKSGENIIDICDAATNRIQEMQEIEQSLPRDIAVAPISNQSKNVAAKIDQVIGNVVGAVLIVVIIVYLMVGFRTAAVMAANIPVVVLAAVALITVFGVQLEQISLASIIIALGLLVDNAVQVCDQSRTNQIDGMPPNEATVLGANQLSIAMLTGTITTIAAFFPMLLALEGSTREYIYSLPVTLSVTLGISWILAMTFCVILAAAFIRAPRDPQKPSAPVPWLVDRINQSLTRSRKQPENVAQDPEKSNRSLFDHVVLLAIRWKFVTAAISFALLYWAISLPVESEFFPKDMRDQFAIEIWLPETSTIAETDRITRQVESLLQALDPVAGPVEEGTPDHRIFVMRSMVGGGGSRWYLSWDPEGTKPNYAEILVRTTDPRYTPWLAKRIREVAEGGDESLGLKPIVGARIIPRELFLGPSSDPVVLRVMGTGFADMGRLRAIAENAKEIIRDQPGTWDINDSWGVPGFQLQVDLNEDRANLAGVTNSKIAESLNAFLSGQQLTTFREGDHLVPVYLRLEESERQSIDAVRTAYVEGVNGKVPLSTIATISPRWEPSRIERRDRNRVIEVRSQVEDGFRGNDIVLATLNSPEMQELEGNLPPGFWIEVGGTLEDSQDSSADLAVCLGISMLLIILTLVIQYNGWAKPAVILTTLPLALIGALPGLYFTGNPLGFMPQLGILSLFGIVLNTGIIFIEFADLLIAEEVRKSNGSGPIAGLSVEQFRQCLVNAARQRLMPIFLTTSTTIGGLLPLALAGGPLWEGMAWAMIFGLIIATLLTLLVVPALYAILAETLRIPPVRVAKES